jgi:hypothetical protein
MVGRLTLDQVVKVRVLAPQLNKNPAPAGFCFLGRRRRRRRGNRWGNTARNRLKTTSDGASTVSCSHEPERSTTTMNVRRNQDDDRSARRAEGSRVRRPALRGGGRRPRRRQTDRRCRCRRDQGSLRQGRQRPEDHSPARSRRSRIAAPSKSDPYRLAPLRRWSAARYRARMDALLRGTLTTDQELLAS